MKTIIIFLAVLVCSANITTAQLCDVNPDYLSSAGWTFVNQGSPVNNSNTVQPGTMNISGGEVLWDGIQDGGFETRYFSPMGEVLCENWQAVFDLSVDGGGSIDWWSFPVVSFTSTTQVPFSIWSGGTPNSSVTTEHDAIAVTLASTGGGSDHFIRVLVNDDGTRTIGCSIPIDYPLNEVEDYTIMLERTSSTSGELTVIYDQTTESCCFEVPSTLNGLSFLQHSNSPTGGSACFLTGSVSELCVQNCFVEVVCPGLLSIPDLTDCVGQTIDFTYTLENEPASIESFFWEVENGISSDLEDFSVGFPDEGELDYTLTITTDNCCQYSTSGTIAISAAPELPNIETNVNLCDGEVYLLDAADYPDWTITDPQGNLIDVFSTETAGIYDFIFDSGCSSETVSIEVEVVSTSGYVNLEDLFICEGDEVIVLLEDWEIIASESSVSVSNGDGWTVEYSGDAVIFSYGDEGEYILTISGSILNCPFEESVLVTVSPVVESFVENEFAICDGETVSLDFEDLPFTVLDESGNPVLSAELSQSGMYTFIGQNSCSLFEEVVVIENTVIDPTSLSSFQLICPVEDTVSVGFSSGNFIYSWESGQDSPNIEVAQSGDYEVLVTDSSGLCSETFVFQVFDQPFEPSVIFDFPLVELCEEGQRTINFPPQHGPYTFTDSLIGLAYTATKTESLFFTYSDGCYTYQDSVFITLQSCLCPVWVPNVFTPDGDGLNDFFRPVLDCEVFDYRMVIFNRWGTEIFESTDINALWRGESPNSEFYANAGVYVYLIFFTQDLDGLRIPTELTGSVTLLR